MPKIKKKYAEHYTVIDNALIKDDRLTWKARGILVYLWAMPDDWNYREIEVAKHAKDGRSSLRAGLDELEKFGYLERKRRRNKDGLLADSEWMLSDKPMFDFPTLDKPTLEKPTSDNQTLLSTDLLSTDLPSTKYDDDPDYSDIFQYWEKLWNKPNAVIVKSIEEWIDEFGTEMIHYMINAAADHSVEKAGAKAYIQKSLDKARKNGITTVEQAEKAEAERNKKTGNPSVRRSKKSNVKETLPDWAKPGYKQPKGNTPLTPEQEEALRRKVDAQLAKLEASKKEANNA